MALLAQKKDQEAIKAFDKTTMGKLDKPLAALIGTLYVYRDQGADELSRKLADCLKSPSPALVSIGLGMLNRADGALKTMRENFNQAIQVSTITEQEKSFAQGQLDQIIQQRKKHSLFMNWIEDLKEGWQLEFD